MGGWGEGGREGGIDLAVDPIKTRFLIFLFAYTVFLRSDAAATIFFAAHFVRLLFKGGVYLFGKPADINNGWIRYVQVRR